MKSSSIVDSSDCHTSKKFQFSFVTPTMRIAVHMRNVSLLLPLTTLFEHSSVGEAQYLREKPTRRPLFDDIAYRALEISDECNAPRMNWIGDGWCDDNVPGYNTEECGWDGGDCCPYTCELNAGEPPFDCSKPMECKDPSVAQLLPPNDQQEQQCIGYFCDKYIDDMFILMTHNSYATEGQFPNQNYPEPQQIRDGIRGFAMDVHEEMNGNIVLEHGELGLSEVDYLQRVQEIVYEMEKPEYRYEFVFIQIEDHLTSGDNGVTKTCEAWGDYLITNFDSNETLGKYIAQGKRVLLMTNNGNHVKPELGMHNANQLLAENEYEWQSTDVAPNMDYRRGPTGFQNQRYAKMMNYFCQDSLGTGSKMKSAIVNAKARMQCHAQEFKQRSYAENTINIMVIDFYDLGNVFEAQEAIRNGDFGADSSACNLETCRSSGSGCSAFSSCSTCCGGSECSFFVFNCKCK